MHFSDKQKLVFNAMLLVVSFCCGYPEDTADATAIAEKEYPWLATGSNCLKKSEDKVYKFDKMTSTSGIFKVWDVFGREHSVEVAHKDLKLFRPTDKSVPGRVEPAVVDGLMLGNADGWLKELEKVEVQAAVLRNCMEQLGCIEVFWKTQFCHRFLQSFVTGFLGQEQQPGEWMLVVHGQPQSLCCHRDQKEWIENLSLWDCAEAQA